MLQDYCAELAPDLVDVVTLSRPGSLSSAETVGSQTLGLWRKALSQDPFEAPANQTPAKTGHTADEARL